MKLKICGMNHNPSEVAELQPDYLGFIFWEPSARYCSGDMPIIPSQIKKVGVFVDADQGYVLEKVPKYQLDAIQLHGKESAEYCQELKNSFPSFRAQSRNLDIIKVFSIKDDFDFGVLEPYEEVCDFYLFDTKGKLPGGNGYTFDWSVLERYPSQKPYFLSGGIGLESIQGLQEFLSSPASKNCYAVDVNSKFESAPGLKNIEDLKTFIESLNSIRN
ncbi:phosphoribosylanthranilate isomerase [Muricauda sp. HICW]|uniref:N-(5'-phosphoribosyl)anthranilate isomerase n=1 Tax=Flagellimonas chongwuensis TaxID=2697365 RepID=A0A850NH66_9FLAO|nr:phosphoribosylanthranilate isomerase [Allomuricauda chongwuensis]NVN19129.1 phosphoribosylanthranilate isomerase [Allomuricauda chongwuensis]